MRPLSIAPSGRKVQFGARLRASRQLQGLTIDQVAEATGLTKGFISRVERDETSLSVASLITLCEVLSLSVGSLLDKPPTAVVRGDEAPEINMGGRGAVEQLVTPRTQAALQVIRSQIEPGGTGGDEPYTINCDIEVIHVVEGELDVVLTDGTTHLAEGDTLSIPGREPHTWTNAGDVYTTVLWILSPAAWTGST